MALRAAVLATITLCWLTGTARAQAPDEPGMASPPSTPTTTPPKTTSPPETTAPAVTPPPVPTTVRTPTVSPAADRAAQATDTEATDTWADQVRRACPEPGTCSEVPRLLRLLRAPTSAVAAARALGESKDARAVLPLLQAAQYGPSSTALNAARDALTRLALFPKARQALRSAASDNPDSALRAIAEAALDAELPEDAQPDDGPVLDYSLRDPDAGRMIYGNTAFTRRKGTWNWTLFNIAFWSIDYGVTDNVQIGIESAPPILIIGLFPNIKASWQVHPWIRLGFRVMGGGFWPYLDEMNDDNWHFFLWGGGPVMTIGGEELNFTLSVPIYGIAVGNEDSRYNSTTLSFDKEMAYDYAWVVLPSIGGSWRVHRRVKLNLELHAPMTNESEINGRLWILMYGLRVIGERIYGDISFIMPLFSGAEVYLQYIPLGAPFLSFGFQW